MPDKPKDWLERATEGFDGAGGVQTATVQSQADKDALLFGDKNKQPEGEEGDDTFIFDETDETIKKHGQGMWRTDVVVGDKTYRYWGKTRTEVTKALIKAQQNAGVLIAEQKAQITQFSAAPARPSAPTNLTPDTKLPFDPIARRQPRNLTQAEILQLSELEQSDPVAAQRIKFEAATGLTVEAFGQAIDKVNEIAGRRIADEAAFAFQADHADDWLPSPGNTALIDKYLKERGWPVTRNNLEIAFQDLANQRKLAMPVADEPTTVPVNQQPVLEEVVVPPPPPVSPPSSAAPRSQAKTEADLVREAAVGIREMPLDEARASLADAFRRQRGTR